MISLTPDGQIREMPKCEMCKERDGFIVAYGGCFCGFCIQKIQAKQQEREKLYITELIKEVKDAS